MILRTSLGCLRFGLLAVLGVLTACSGTSATASARGGSAGAQGSSGGAGGSLPDAEPGPVCEPSPFAPGTFVCRSYTHRESVDVCISHLPRPSATEQHDGQCQEDADCSAEAYGHCEVTGTPAGPRNRCYYGCTTDEECGLGAVCICGADIGHCVPAECSTDSDCLTGERCASQGCADSYPLYGGPGGFGCLPADGSCRTDADCTGGTRCLEATDGPPRCKAPWCGD